MDHDLIARADRLLRETLALAQAIMVQQPRLDTIVALHHASKPGSDATSALVTPCGMCRELLSDYAPHLHVIVPGGRGEPTSIAISELLPCKFVRPPENP